MSADENNRPADSDHPGRSDVGYAPVCVQPARHASERSPTASPIGAAAKNTKILAALHID